ncbi:MAG: glycosyltransferase [Candidatus Rokuibacteriota bacterium]
MAAVTTSVVLVVHNQVALTRACVESLQSSTAPFELAIVDNASSDGTVDYLDELARALPLRYRRNDDNVGLIRALNQGAELATGDLLCFLHNDTEMRDPRWIERLEGAVRSPTRIGLAGLYGARRLRRDGRYVGRTIVHCLEDVPTLRGPRVEVAAVDGVCLFLAREVLEAVGRFDEGYGFHHGYDRDLSFAVRELGLRCAIVNVPFRHRGGGTRTGEGAPVAAPADLAERQAALARFARKWRRRLPSDVRRLPERLRDWLGRPWRV